MNRIPALFFLICFLATQSGSLLHMAEHEFEEHEHNGLTCPIYYHLEQSKNCDHSIALAVGLPQFDEIEIDFVEKLSVQSKNHHNAYPRAPPRYS